jgi:superfamily II DNA or RNA helicase
VSSQLVDPPVARDATGRSVPFEILVDAEASGEASAPDRAILEANKDLWRTTLERLLDDTEDGLERVRTLTGPERDQVVADFEQERSRLSAALARLTGVPAPGSGPKASAALPPVAHLQVSWSAGELVAWVGGPGLAPLPADEVRSWLADAGANTTWQDHAGVPIPGGPKAPAVSAPVRGVLGWLLAMAAQPHRGRAGDPAGQEGADADGTAAAAADRPGVDADGDTTEVDDRIGPSVGWLALMAKWAVDLVAQGRMVPHLESHKGSKRPGDRVGLAVRWAPALVDARRLSEMARTVPGVVTALDERPEPAPLTRAILGEMVHAICVEGTARLEMPAVPDLPAGAPEAAEAMLSRLDGTPFFPSKRVGVELANRIDRWAKPVTHAAGVQLIVQLDPPDEGDAWMLKILVDGVDRRPTLLDRALVTSPVDKRRQVEAELTRLERLLPALTRPSGLRRGEVVLSNEEAWELMSRLGRQLADAGFDVRVPKLATRRPSPTLRLEADASTPSVVGANQLTNVSWSVLFDDLELDAAEIRRLASQARPLVQSRGQWIAIDHVDLAAAAEALAERANQTQLTGADLLRHALGLEGNPLSGGLTIAGESWAADLMRRAEEVKTEPLDAPDGFVGELRSYQAEALAWLGFLDGAGLGGCLALDMGLGKTPTMLAHLMAHRDRGATLVIAPPAVVGNWAAEAQRFTPGLEVVVHHGASRASVDDLADEIDGADVVLTTYGTAVRDIEALAEISWRRLVLDEAQSIKNPASETAQQLRRIEASSRVALTGTPIENGLGDLWAILDFTNPGLVGPRAPFIANLSADRDGSDDRGEQALRALNGLLVFRRTKAEPAIAAELPERIDQLDHCSMTPEQIGLYQAVLDQLTDTSDPLSSPARKGQVLAAITALKQICNHPQAYRDDDLPLAGRSGKLNRLEEIVDSVLAAGEKVLIFTHFATWGVKLADHLSERIGQPVECYHGGLSRGARDKMIAEFQTTGGPGALVLSLKAGGTGLNLTAASHVVLYDRWWNPAVEDQARDRAWRIGQTRTVVAHRLVCPGTVDERVEEVVAGKRQIADLVLPKSSSIADLDAAQLRQALGLSEEALMLSEDSAQDLVGEPA